MAAKGSNQSSRRTFVRSFGLLFPGFVFVGNWQTPRADTAQEFVNDGFEKNSDQWIGECKEVMYQDADSSAYLVELANGELVVGFGPPNLECVASWEAPELVNGNIPSVIFHPALSISGRNKLTRLLPAIT